MQKVIAVSNSEQIERIGKHASGLGEDFISSLSFWNVADVEDTHDKLSDVKRSIEKLDLVTGEFEFENK